MEFASRVKGKMLSVQICETLENIYFLNREAGTNGPLKNFKKVREHGTLITGISIFTI